MEPVYVQLTFVCCFTWQSVHCVPPGSVPFWLDLHTARPTLTPVTTGHTLNLSVCMRVCMIERREILVLITLLLKLENYLAFNCKLNSKRK